MIPNLILAAGATGGPARRGGARGGRYWVYGRGGEPCLRCGATVEVRRQGEAARSTYWCPQCQPARPDTARRPGGTTGAA